MIYVFGDFELDTQLYELRQAGRPLQLEPKVFDLLAYVMLHRDRVVTRQELFEHLWPEQFISDATFDHCIMAARKAVGDSGRAQQVIRTMRGRGYRCVVAMTVLGQEASSREVTTPAAPISSAAPPADALDCPQCQHRNTVTAKFCTECGTPVQPQGVCPQCHQRHAPESKFCGACGRALSSQAFAQARDSHAAPQAYTPRHLAEQILTTRSALEGERKQVTVLFCDLPDSMGLAASLGPERMHALLNRFFELALNAMHQYGGTINQFLGDGFMALFGAPLAHEDHAWRGVLAALELQDSLQQHQQDFIRLQAAAVRAGPRQIQVRMGLHTGVVVVGSIGDNLRMDYTAVGDTTNLAARLQQVAEVGTTLVSENTARLVQHGMQLQSLGTVYVKGKNDPVPVRRVLGRGPRRTVLETRLVHGVSRFVGRDHELRTLHDVLAQVESGHGQVVGLIAEPGMGKSRLVYEFLHSLAGKHVAYLEGHCMSYGSMMPYLPVLDMVRHYCGIAETDSPAALAEKVRRHLYQMGLVSNQGVACLLQLLGVKEDTEHLALLSSEMIKARTCSLLCQMSLERSKHQPLIIVLEDLHWSDRSSEDFFATLADSLASAPILLLATYRPGYQPPWSGKSYVTQIALHSLTPADSLAVVYSGLQQDSLPQPLAQIMLEKAGGNPLFLEELTRVIVAQGGIRPDTAVPDTLQGVLMARIDRLPDTAKRLLQTAAVLGRTFATRLLRAIWDETADFEAALHALKQTEFLYEEHTAGELIYVFKHALTQEVAYDSLLMVRRHRLHAAAARALEQLYAQRLEDAYDHLAYHYSRAEQPAKAVTYLRRFAEKVAREHAHVEAILALQGALGHVAHLPDDDERRRLYLDLNLRLGLSLVALGRYQEALEHLRQQQEGLSQWQDAWLHGRYALLYGQTCSYLGDWPQAARRAEQAIEAALQCADHLTLGQAYHVLAMERYWNGYPAAGLEYSQKAITALEQVGADYRLGMAYFVLGLNAMSLGSFTFAQEAATHARAIGVALADRRLQTFAAWTTGWLHATRGEWAAGIAACQEALERSSDPLNTAFAMGWLGYAYVEKNDPVAALPVLEQAVQSMHQFGYRRLAGLYTVFLGEAHLLQGDIETARALALQGLTITSETPYGLGMAWAHRTLGRIAQAAGTLPDAEQQCTEALTLFSTAQARFEVGRTHLALATLAQQQGNREAVIMHCTEAHHIFMALDVPVYVQRTAQQAQALGLAFAIPVAASAT